MSEGRAGEGDVPHTGVAAVLFDRDGTLIDDVPYNGDPDRVSLVPAAGAAVRRLRQAGIPVGLVTNQSGIGRGLLTHRQVNAVNRRLEDQLGPFDVCLYCPHAPEDHCDCRKPAPGLVLIACEILGVDPAQVIVIGDTEADVAAAEAAGGRGILVPNEVTLRDEVERARLCAPDLLQALDLVLGPAEATR
ncbi:HAD-IIIA family hydrolase [Microbacterium horticulturae]|uniref:D,D-heptose 1,7-bisphosphate phosphatase n=1 Tax=Microbacterium horticulturae TaxID=3028316 RepID=A0ABY8BZ62_9MICO|nr:HAD-IIIA family hydrolase [Microbacterium sp. KACC 23027]WEG09490.1 HAD-IIIA family hydrolase [Microbacterium sp. KACC 23027]